MLRVSIHAGRLRELSIGNQVAVLDVAYHKKHALADYLVALSTRQAGEVSPAHLMSYPRWSASLWDLVARALTRVLYQADQAPPAAKPDRRCAYATQLCATMQRVTADNRAHELATVDIAQVTGQRGTYQAIFKEDILGERTGTFDYGCKALNPVDLLLRAICFTYYGDSTLGPKPALLVPVTLSLEGVDRFDAGALPEPARTGFQRFRADALPAASREGLAFAQDYVTFLLQS